MRAISVIAIALLVIGGLNWGLVGLFQFDLVAAIFGGQDSVLARAVYVIVGIAAIFGVGSLLREARTPSTHGV
jgi:uncharacterized membrane protein YuzA (DUF378 family)